ncbi:MAG: bifunctional diaminohydroxyphosphoribosylaminopyrimidine deaminase/5-amino-6-(5-phosphoribosylamino)uracil reductase RibD [Candidatus Bipolaricaulota bacterium]|nr:bifunctional diaminohydroxyphosphoribosylaminopyrimidine deaminase/5-amino-6-(5-phosphoribosylamino)uracil reductase RibD [Candidatus Bipolaricaulota bacterium]
MTDQEWMRLAINLAELGEGDVNPNPLVGAVVVRDDQVVGRGYHRRFGGPHAEIHALDEAGDAARGATLYVTLEPCCHYGKTPPCTDRILQSGIRRVVVAAADPNPVISGRGLATLRAAGIEVTEDVLAEAALRQIEIFRKYITTGLPFVHLKLATSLDGRIATKTGDARWISSEASRIRAHQLRRRHAAILVGIGTALSDDPRLDVRHVFGRSPTPIVLDAHGGLPLTARLLRTGLSPIVAASAVPPERRCALEQAGCRVWEIPSPEGGVDLPLLVRRVGEAGLDSILVEGGGETAASFLAAGLVDRVSFFVAPLLIGGRDAVPAIGGLGIDRVEDAARLVDVTTEPIDGDLLISGRIPPGPSAAAPRP